MMKQKEKTGKKELKLFDRFMNSLFVKSFSNMDRNFLYVIFVDLILISLIFLVVISSSSLMKTYIDDSPELKLLYEDMQTYISLYGYESIPDMPPAIREKYLSSSDLIYSLLMRYIATIVISFIFIVFLISMFQAFVWSRLLKKNFNLLFFKMFFQLSILWFAVWLFILALLMFVIKPGIGSIFIVMGILFFVHFTQVLFSLFDEKKKIISQVKTAFRIGIKFNLFIAPWLWSYVVLVLFFLLFSLISIPFSLDVKLILGILLFFVYYAWFRIYILFVIDKIERKIKTV